MIVYDVILFVIICILFFVDLYLLICLWKLKKIRDYITYIYRNKYIPSHDYRYELLSNSTCGET